MHGPLNMAGSPQSWVSYEISNAEDYKGPYGGGDPTSPWLSDYGILDRGLSPSV